jgi:hypothetical protein
MRSAVCSNHVENLRGVRKSTLAGKAGLGRGRDFHATVLHLLGFDQPQRLTGVEPVHVIPELLT